MADKQKTQSIPSHKVLIDVPYDDFVTPPPKKKPKSIRKKTTLVTDSTKKKKNQKKTKKKIEKKIVVEEPAPIDSKSLTERLLEAGLNAKETADLVVLKKKQERKDKIERLMQPQTTLTQCFRKQNELNSSSRPDTVTPRLQRSLEVLTQFSQPSSPQSDTEPPHPIINGGGLREHSKEECEMGRSKNGEFLPFEDGTDCISLEDFDRTPNRIKREGGSSDAKISYTSTVTRTVETKSAYYDLTVEEESCSGDVLHVEPCKHCGNVQCHDTLFGDYCFASVQRYYLDDKLMAFNKQAERVFVKAYNAIFDVYKFQTQQELLSFQMDLYPPSCVEVSSMTRALQWFDCEKKAFTRHFRPAKVLAKEIKLEKKESTKKISLTWQEHDVKVHKRKYGGI